MSLPKINKITPIAQSKLFNIESVDLTFSNGTKRIYERLSPHHHRSVMVIPMLDEETFILVREYSVGIEDYINSPNTLKQRNELKKKINVQLRFHGIKAKKIQVNK